jgi:hypothetical protein
MSVFIFRFVHAGVKNAWSYTSTPQYIFMAWCLVKRRDNFTFTNGTILHCTHVTDSSAHLSQGLITIWINK